MGRRGCHRGDRSARSSDSHPVMSSPCRRRLVCRRRLHERAVPARSRQARGRDRLRLLDSSARPGAAQADVPAPHQVAAERSSRPPSCARSRATAASSITPGSRSPRRCSASPRHGARHPARGRHRPCHGARPQPDAVDHRLADHTDPGDRANGGRGLAAVGITGLYQGADLDLPVVLPGHGRHGEGPALARTDRIST